MNAPEGSQGGSEGILERVRELETRLAATRLHAAGLEAIIEQRAITAERELERARQLLRTIRREECLHDRMVDAVDRFLAP